ncbi:MAG: hypothetical protein PVI40_08545 [Chlamydiota bacterium]|jgi:hypothetical protein
MEFNQISNNLFLLASTLTEPICIAHEKLFSKVLLEDNDKLYPKNSILSTSSKISNLVQSTLLTVIGIPLAAIGVAVRFIAIHINPNNFSYYQTSAPELPFNENNIDLFFQNICGIAGGFPTIQSKLKPWRERLDIIVENIRREDKPLIFLEEVYDHKIGLELIEKLKSQYPHFIFNTGPISYGSPMGLFIASKYPINTPKFSYFPTATNIGETKFIGKGIFSCYMGDTLFILSHLQHSKNHKKPLFCEISARAEQIKIIEKFIQKEKKKNSNIRVVFLGDLNFKAEEMDQLKLSDRFQIPQELDQPSSFPTKKVYDGEKVSLEDGYTIDHILMEKNSNSEVTVEILPAFDIHQMTADYSSDHHCLIGKITN